MVLYECRKTMCKYLNSITLPLPFLSKYKIVTLAYLAYNNRICTIKSKISHGFSYYIDFRYHSCHFMASILYQRFNCSFIWLLLRLTYTYYTYSTYDWREPKLVKSSNQETRYIRKRCLFIFYYTKLVFFVKRYISTIYIVYYLCRKLQFNVSVIHIIVSSLDYNRLNSYRN